MTNVIFAGVGGQGVILASKILMEVGLLSDLDVKESEVHGMAQRGGSVDCHVRLGDKVHSPLIPRGQANFIVSFELLEGLRKLEYLQPAGYLLINKKKINPSPVQTGAMTYPDNIENWISQNIAKAKLVETEKLLLEIGTKKAINVVMLGLLSTYLPFDSNKWHQAIERFVKPRFLEQNMKAFEQGRAL